MAFLCLFNSSHKASILSLGKDELTIKGDLRLESRNAYMRFDDRGFSSNSTSSLDIVSFESSSLLEVSSLDIPWKGWYGITSEIC